MKCDVCNQKKECLSWDYVVKRDVFGSVRNFTPGTDTVYKVGGKVTGIEKDTSYGKGWSSKSSGVKTAYLCMKCRIIWSVVLTLVFSLLITFFVLLFLLLLKSMMSSDPKGDMISILIKTFECSLIILCIFSFTPIMKHIILSIKLSRYYKVLPWKIVSKFWG